MKDIEFVVVGATKETPHRALAAALAQESDRFDTVATHPDEPAFWLYSSGSTGMPKGTKHLHTSLMATARLFAQQTLGMRESDVVLFGRQALFRLRARQRADVSDVGRRDRGAVRRPADAGGGVRGAAARAADHLLRRPDRLRGDARRSELHARDRLAAAAAVRLGRRGAARAHRNRVEGALRRRHRRRRRLDRDAAHLPVEPSGRHPLRHLRTRGARL